MIKKFKSSKTYRMIIKYIFECKFDIVMAGLCFIVLGGISFFRPIMTRHLTDKGLIGLNYKIIVWTSLFLLLLAVVERAVDIFQNNRFIMIHNHVELGLLKETFSHLLRCKLDYFKDHEPSEISSRINYDVSIASEIANRSAMYIITQAIRMLSGLIGLLVISPKLTLVVLIVIPIKFFSVRYLSDQKNTLVKKSMTDTSNLYAWLGDMISGIKEIKLWNLYGSVTQKYEDKMGEIYGTNVKISKNDRYNFSTDVLLEFLLEVIIYLIGGLFVCRGEMTIGSLFSFSTYKSYITGPITYFLNIKMFFAQISPAADRLDKFMQTETEDTLGSKNVSLPLRIDVRSLSYSYENADVLRSIDLSVHTGEKIALIGENGSGKSTLINLILRFITPKSGNITFNGINISDIPLDMYRDLFAVVNQDTYYFQGSISENIDLKGILNESATKALIEKCKLDSDKLGQDKNVGNNGSKISGGEKQKVAFARMLGKDAPVIILDEANSGLDTETDRYFNTMLTKDLNDKIIIVITHRLEHLEDFDRIYRLEEGILREISM